MIGIAESDGFVMINELCFSYSQGGFQSSSFEINGLALWNG
jgi:hypothetical protein